MTRKNRYIDPLLAEIILPADDHEEPLPEPQPTAPEREIGSCCVAVLIVENGRVLLIQEEEKSFRDRSGTVVSLWGFPGGGRKPQETLIETAEREVLEEVGISATVSCPIYEKRLPDQDHSERDHLFVVMLGSNPRGTYKQGSGITKIEWHPLTQAPLAHMLPKHRDALLEYLSTTPQLSA